MRERPIKNAYAPDEHPAIAEVVDAFYRIRDGYDYGYGYGHGDFDMSEHDEAVAAAKALIRPIIYNGVVSSWINYSLEERWIVRFLDAEAMGAHGPQIGSERSVGSHKVVLLDSEKAAKLALPEYASQISARASE